MQDLVIEGIESTFSGLRIRVWGEMVYLRETDPRAGGQVNAEREAYANFFPEIIDREVI